MRLTKESVERQVREMWDAMSDTPRDEYYDQACEQCREVERKLRDRLAAQDRLDATAPYLLEAIKGIESLAQYSDGAFLPDIIKICKTAILKAEGK